MVKIVCSFLLGFFLLSQGFAHQITIGRGADELQVIVEGHGFKSHEYYVNFYLDGKYKKQIIMVDGQFSADLNLVLESRELDVRVLEYNGPGKDGHLNQKFFLNQVDQQEKNYISTSYLRNGRLTISGQKFSKNLTKQVNIYLKGRFNQKVTLVDGKFSTVLSGVKAGDEFRVSVLNYNGPAKHFVRKFIARIPHQRTSYNFDKSENPRISVSKLQNGEVQLTIKGFQRKYQVNYYVNDRFFKQEKIHAGSSRTVVEGLVNGDVLVLKVLNFYKPGEHLEQRFKVNSQRGVFWDLVTGLGIMAGVVALMSN